MDFEGTGYAPEGEVRRADGGDIDGPLRDELSRALAAADRANNAVLQERGGRWTVQGDPTEGALIVAARKAGMSTEALDERFERVGEVPFSSERKLMSTVHTTRSDRRCCSRSRRGLQTYCWRAARKSRSARNADH